MYFCILYFNYDFEDRTEVINLLIQRGAERGGMRDNFLKEQQHINITCIIGEATIISSMVQLVYLMEQLEKKRF